MNMFTHLGDAGMIREEESLMIRNLTQEQEITTGRINISEVFRDTTLNLTKNRMPPDNSDVL